MAGEAGTGQFHGLIRRAYPPNTFLYQEGEAAERLYVIERGRVRLSRLTAGGQRLIVETLTAGQVCGEEVLRPGTVYKTSAETVQPTTVIAVSHPTLHELALAKPGLLVTLLARLEERLERAEERLVEVATKSLSSRVAAALLHEMAGCACPVLALTHQELAEMVGGQRETVSRLLASLRQRGAIRLSYGRIEVLNPGLLEAVGETCQMRWTKCSRSYSAWVS